MTLSVTGPLPVRAGGLALAGFEPFSVSLVGAHARAGPASPLRAASLQFRESAPRGCASRCLTPSSLALCLRSLFARLARHNDTHSLFLVIGNTTF